jgi:hypothetical protein
MPLDGTIGVKSGSVVDDADFDLFDIVLFQPCEYG